ncbi:MAG: PH domain-containing protein [Planctomycetes bacterium]|nr:PH domain-containing protein [Planctomycetota bacterium]
MDSEPPPLQPTSDPEESPSAPADEPLATSPEPAVPLDPDEGMLPLPKRALRVDQGYALTLGAIGPFIAGSVGGAFLGLLVGAPLQGVALGGILLALIVVPLRVFVFAPIAWSRFRYRIEPEFVRIRSGVIVVTYQLIPLVRVQNVDSSQGPLERHYGLADVKIHNAASTYVIPNLEEAEAERLREHLAQLVRVARDEA